MKGQLEARGLYGWTMSIKECLLFLTTLAITSSQTFSKNAAIKQKPDVKNRPRDIS